MVAKKMMMANSDLRAVLNKSLLFLGDNDCEVEIVVDDVTYSHGDGVMLHNFFS